MIPAAIATMKSLQKLRRVNTDLTSHQYLCKREMPLLVGPALRITDKLAIVVNRIRHDATACAERRADDNVRKLVREIVCGHHAHVGGIVVVELDSDLENR